MPIRNLWRHRDRRATGAAFRVAAAAGAVLALLVLVPTTASTLASTTTTTTTTSTSTTSTSTTLPARQHPAATAIPDSQLQNFQVVTVSWAGFKPTAPKPTPGAGYANAVGIMECVANPPGGKWFYYRDCMVDPTPGAVSGASAGGDGNAIGFYPNTIYGVTGSDGTGSHTFQVLSGTIHNSLGGRYQPPHGPVRLEGPANIQCDASNPCVLKVISYPAPYGAGPGAAPPWANLSVGGPRPPYNYTSLLDAAASVPLNFGIPLLCPQTTAGTLRIEGASSSSYAVDTWAAALCQGANPVTISYAENGEAVARRDFLTGSTSVALAALAPTPSELAGAPNSPSYAAAPLDAGGVSIVFNLRDAATGIPITHLRLTPRLVAMLITNSGTLDPNYVPYHDLPGATFQWPLTSDPEFKALNPGFTPPAYNTAAHGPPQWYFQIEEPMVRSDQTDDTSILTQWIASDYDAQKYLQGNDPCGAPVNMFWQGISYPTNQFLDNEKGLAGTTPMADLYFPMHGTLAVTQHFLYQIPVGGLPNGLGGSTPPQGKSPQQSAYFAIMDTTAARRNVFPQATLIAANPLQSELANYVDHSGPYGSCAPLTTPINTSNFVAPDDAGLSAAYRDMTATPGTGGLFVPPVASTDPSAYPLAKVDYAFVPTSGIGLPTAQLIASMLRYAAGPGQVSPNLAYGYTPLPSSLTSETLGVAALVVKNATPATTPPTTTPTTAAPAKSSTPVAGNPVSAQQPATATTPIQAASPASTTGTTVATVPFATPAPGTKTARLEAEGAVSVGAAGLLAGIWLLPLIGGLGLLSLVSGVLMRRRVAKAARGGA